MTLTNEIIRGSRSKKETDFPGDQVVMLWQVGLARPNINRCNKTGFVPLTGVSLSKEVEEQNQETAIDMRYRVR